MNDIYCAYDKDRICDDTCGAYDHSQESMIHTAYFDESNPIPQYNWKKLKVLIGPMCMRGRGFPIIKLCKVHLDEVDERNG